MTELDAQKKAIFRLHYAGAEEDDAFDQTLLGICYHCGGGVPPSKVIACMWLNIAVSNFLKGRTEDRDFSKELRDIVMKEMTPEEIAEAKKLTKQWIKKRQSDRYFLEALES